LLSVRQRHNRPVQTYAGQTCTVQDVFRKQTQSSQYCGCVVKANGDKADTLNYSVSLSDGRKPVLQVETLQRPVQRRRFGEPGHSA